MASWLILNHQLELKIKKDGRAPTFSDFINLRQNQQMYRDFHGYVVGLGRFWVQPFEFGFFWHLGPINSFIQSVLKEAQPNPILWASIILCIRSANGPLEIEIAKSRESSALLLLRRLSFPE
ncbi:unnamed protein product [Citrullus colocynthis]|uniref:Uncharacterized protein n=1 Tax=Citrullus colocynthis TaxID=252529 RepID=A0ABP0YR10_9ROSI